MPIRPPGAGPRAVRRRSRGRAAPEGERAFRGCNHPAGRVRSGCAALTASEARFSNCRIPAFKKPESKNGIGRTLMWMAIRIWGVLHRHVRSRVPHQLGVQHSTRSGRPAQIGADGCSATRRCSTRADRDGRHPDPGGEHELRRLPTAGLHPGAGPLPVRTNSSSGATRLAFSNGIVVLGAAAAMLLVIFEADVDRLIRCNAFGLYSCPSRCRRAAW